MVSDKKRKTAKEVKELMHNHKVIGILDMHKLPAKQLFELRKRLKSHATIRVVKKRVINLALKDSKLQGIEQLSERMQWEPGLLFSNENPFKLAVMLNESKSTAPAKPGDMAPHDIEIKAGPTSLPVGPAIGELQRLKIPAGVEGDKIVVKKDTLIVKSGELIQKPIAEVLAKLGIEPMEIGLNLLAVWENGIIYPKEILSIPPGKYLDDLKYAHSRAFNLAFSINYYTEQNVPLFLSKAHREALSLADSAGVVLPETISGIFAKAKTHHDTLEKKVQTPQESKQEETNEDTQS